MKTSLESSITRNTLLALSIAALFSLPSMATARVTGGRGNLASAPVKGAQRLMNVSRTQSAEPVYVAKSGSIATHCCPECKDTWVRVTENSFKGGRATQLGGKTQHLAAQHLCPGCSTHRIANGCGKNKIINTAHTCSQCDSDHASCSSTPHHSSGTPAGVKG